MNPHSLVSLRRVPVLALTWLGTGDCTPKQLLNACVLRNTKMNLSYFLFHFYLFLFFLSFLLCDSLISMIIYLVVIIYNGNTVNLPFKETLFKNSTFGNITVVHKEYGQELGRWDQNAEPKRS